jgi:hypothetical protein
MNQKRKMSAFLYSLGDCVCLIFYISFPKLLNSFLILGWLSQYGGKAMDWVVRVQLEGTGVFFSLCPHPDWHWGHPASSPVSTRGFFHGSKSSWGMKLTIHLHLVLKLRMHRAIPPFLIVVSFLAAGSNIFASLVHMKGIYSLLDLLSGYFYFQLIIK